MNNKEKIIKILNRYIEQNKKLKEERGSLISKISLYEELLNLLKLDTSSLLENSIIFSHNRNFIH